MNLYTGNQNLDKAATCGLCLNDFTRPKVFMPGYVFHTNCGEKRNLFHKHCLAHALNSPFHKNKSKCPKCKNPLDKRSVIQFLKKPQRFESKHHSPNHTPSRSSSTKLITHNSTKPGPKMNSRPGSKVPFLLKFPKAISECTKMRVKLAVILAYAFIPLILTITAIGLSIILSKILITTIIAGAIAFVAGTILAIALTTFACKAIQEKQINQ